MRNICQADGMWPVPTMAPLWYLEHEQQNREQSQGKTYYTASQTPYLYHRLIISQVCYTGSTDLSRCYIGQWSTNGIFYDQSRLLIVERWNPGQFVRHLSFHSREKHI